MPLTQAHPAAAVPFRRLGLPLSALVMGSMMPDTMKFLTLHPANDFGHSLSGIVWFCVPAGLIALAIFHFLLKVPLFSLLPVEQQRRLMPHLNFSFGPVSQFCGCIAGLIIGAATHIVWDSFTHRFGFAVRHIPPLAETVLTIRNHPVRLYTILQHMSTVIGLALLGFWYIRWHITAPRAEQPIIALAPKTKIMLWIVLITCAVLPAVGYGTIKAQHLRQVSFIKVFAGRTIIAATFILCTELFVYSLAWRFFPVKNRSEATGPSKWNRS